MSRAVPTSPPRPPAADRFWSDAEVVLAPDDPGPGAWAGGPSAQLVDGTWWLAYRLRRPVGEGRGFANVVARSDDGVRFTPVVELGKDAFGAESLERPALVHTPDGRVAALRQLRDAGHQALAGRPAGGRLRRGAGDGDPAHRAAGQRDGRGQGPGDPARRRSSGTCGRRCTRSTTRTPPTG